MFGEIGVLWRENFGGSLVHSLFLMYSPDGTNAIVQEVESLRV